MKVTFNWLKQYVDFPWSPDELKERLTMLGLEVEGMTVLGGEFSGIVVGQVITKDKHPNADKLSVCRVNDGHGERQVVCGAHNFKPGDKVALILPGASLPPKPGEKEPFTIKVGKIRSVESHGMMCSPQELGLPDAVDGLLILREDAKVGQTFAEHLGRAVSDTVFDLEVTPNRPDLNSVIGIAREISALTGNPLKLPELTIVSGPISAVGIDAGSMLDQWVAVKVYEPELCPRYTARIVQGVKVGPSPDWLRTTLENVGVRSINNVVDVTNYVMLEVGQPLHAFDYHLLKGLGGAKPAIVVRRAAEGEEFATLDGQKRTLSNEMLLIADENKGIALAGIMGGQNTEINDATRDVLIESACFHPQNIRRTSKQLGLRSESSYRFERGADIGICDWASARAAQLILELAGGSLVPGLIDACGQPVEPKQISLRHAKVGQLLGIEISAAENVKHLTSLALEVVGQSNEGCPFKIPTFRVDLKREVDLIEEIARLHGVDKIQATAPRGAIGTNAFDAVYDQMAEARRILAGLGVHEMQGQTLISSDEALVASAEPVRLANPLSSDMDVLRPSLLPGLLNALRHNLHRKNNELALFEIGRVFAQAGGQTREERRVAVALTGKRYAAFWDGLLSRAGTESADSTRSSQRQDYRLAQFDIYDLKGLLEEFFDQFGLRGVTWTRRAQSTELFLESADIQLGGKLALGEFGQLLPTVARRYDLRDPVLLAELSLEVLLTRRNPGKSFKPLSAFPAIRRDVAMLVPEATTHEAVLNLVRQAKPPNLENTELFDVFRGSSIPAGQKSVAYAFTYRHAERTLTDPEVNAAHDKLVAKFKESLHAVIRES